MAGPAVRPTLVSLPADSTIVGVRFRPGMAPGLLGPPAPDLLEAQVPLLDLRGRASPRLPGGPLSALTRLAILQRALLARLDRAAPVDGLVRAAVARIRADPSARIGDLGGELGLSDRLFRRRFAAAVGYDPKSFQRVTRFQRWLRLAQQLSTGARSLAGLAVEAGYADQAHLTREVGLLAGITPRALATGACCAALSDQPAR